MCHAFIQDKTNLFPLVHLLSDSLEDENRQDNIQMLNDDEEEAIWKILKPFSISKF